MRFFLFSASTFILTIGIHLFSEECNLSHYYEIAKENCQDISDIRREMDRINNEILKLLTERTAYVKRAGDLKSQTTKIADDRQRVADQERKITDQSIALELPTEISLPAFRVIMENSIQFQQEYIDQLSLHR
jgi:chorismate mutase